MDTEQISAHLSPAGELTTALINEVFLLNDELLCAGDALTADAGLTSVRWQVRPNPQDHRAPLVMMTPRASRSSADCDRYRPDGSTASPARAQPTSWRPPSAS